MKIFSVYTVQLRSRGYRRVLRAYTQGPPRKLKGKFCVRVEAPNRHQATVIARQQGYKHLQDWSRIIPYPESMSC